MTPPETTALGSPAAARPASAGRVLRGRRGLRRWEIVLRPGWTGPGGEGVDDLDPVADAAFLEGLFDIDPPGERIHTARYTRVTRLGQGRFAGLIHKIGGLAFPFWLWTPLARLGPWREFDNLCRLQDAGFPAVEPLAAGRSGWGPFDDRAFLLTRERVEAVTLGGWADARLGKVRPNRPPVPAWAAELSPEQAHGLAGELVERLARLHAEGMRVGTFYGKNVLVSRDAEGRLHTSLCDVPRLRVTDGPLPPEQAAIDLAALDKWAARVFGRTQRLRLLRRYRDAARAADAEAPGATHGSAAGEAAGLRRLLGAVAERRAEFESHSWFRPIRKRYRWVLGRFGIHSELPQ